MQTLPPRMRRSASSLSRVTDSRTIGLTGLNDKILEVFALFSFVLVTLI